VLLIDALKSLAALTFNLETEPRVRSFSDFLVGDSKCISGNTSFFCLSSFPLLVRIRRFEGA
jgi:hypothetical protein